MEKYTYIIPEEAQDVMMSNVKVLRKIENQLRDLFSTNNYAEVFMPTFEYTDLYREIPMGIPVEQLFQFFNNEGKAVALRADFTFPLARFHAHRQEQVGRYCYFGKVYRKQLSHKGRASEIFQAGIELMGLDESTGDQECMKELADSLKLLQLKTIKIELGSAAFFERLEVLLGDNQGVLKAILKRRDISAMEKWVAEKVLDKQINEPMAHFLNQLISLCGGAEVFQFARIYLQDESLLKALDHLENIFQLSSIPDLTVDLAMVPTFSYYTGLMIQGYIPNAAEAIISGGRYDRLSNVFEKQSQAIGLSYNLDLISQMEETV